MIQIDDADRCPSCREKILGVNAKFCEKCGVNMRDADKKTHTEFNVVGSPGLPESEKWKGPHPGSLFCPFCSKLLSVLGGSAKEAAATLMPVECKCGAKIDVSFTRWEKKLVLTVHGASAECFADQPFVYDETKDYVIPQSKERYKRSV